MKTLFLNQNYEPLSLISWERAVHLYFLDKVEVIEEYEQKIRSPSFSMRIPAVVISKHYIRNQKKISRFSRMNIFLRDNFTCLYCGDAFSKNFLTLDHVIPKSKGGEKTWSNIVTACKDCNCAKANRTPAEARMALVKPPRVPNIKEYIIFLGIDSRQVPHQWLQFLPGIEKEPGVKII